MLFRKHRHLTSPALTKTQLEKGQRVRAVHPRNKTRVTDSAMTQWLDVFERAKQGDGHLRSVLQRFERLICARRDHDRMARIVDESLVRSVFFPLPPTLREN